MALIFALLAFIAGLALAGLLAALASHRRWARLDALLKRSEAANGIPLAEYAEMASDEVRAGSTPLVAPGWLFDPEREREQDLPLSAPRQVGALAFLRPRGS